MSYSFELLTYEGYSTNTVVCVPQIQAKGLKPHPRFGDLIKSTSPPKPRVTSFSSRSETEWLSEALLDLDSFKASNRTRWGHWDQSPWVSSSDPKNWLRVVTRDSVDPRGGGGWAETGDCLCRCCTHVQFLLVLKLIHEQMQIDLPRHVPEQSQVP